MDKGIRDVDAIARKLEQALTKVINHGWKVFKEERQKKEEMMKRQKTKVRAAKRQRTIRGISLSSK